ncbi:MAG TPA: response regulator [Candidatus Saccharimonadales bacterium]|nr:response regulator [Candidatus Saccharimonadales bacterium]
MKGAVVLVVDDLKLFVQMETSLLARAGFEVLTAEAGERALELARQQPPHLILLDLNMPGMDGAAACAAMRREPALALTPIIIMSARGSREDRIRCLEAGCTEFVVKPEQPEELLGLVARILAARRRKMTRISVVFGVTGKPGGRQIVGLASDLSGTGLLLVSSRPVETGAVLELEFLVPKIYHPVKLKGKVTRARENAEGAFEMGVHFVDISQGDQESILDYIAA